MRRVALRLCALALVVALAAGPVIGALDDSPRCTSCAPDCPMHARHLGCHGARQHSCHRTAGDGLYSACGHGVEQAVQATAWRFIASPATADTLSLVGAALATARASLPPTPFREPPIDPPRALLG